MAIAKNNRIVNKKDAPKSEPKAPNRELAAEVVQDAERVEVTKPDIKVCPFADKLTESGAILAGPYKNGIQPIERTAEAVTTVGTIKLKVKLFAAGFAGFHGQVSEFKDRKQAVAWLRENRRALNGNNGVKTTHKKLMKIVDLIAYLQDQDEVEGEGEYTTEWSQAKVALWSIMARIEEKHPGLNKPEEK